MPAISNVIIPALLYLALWGRDRMSEVTRILSQIESGDRSAADQLLPLVYDELRKLARAKLSNEKPGQTLQATALVHEAYVRLVDGANTRQWDSRGHFFSAAAEAMRRILIDRAREKGCEKRGSKLKRVDLDSLSLATSLPPEQVLIVDEALSKLSLDDAIAAQLVKLRYFAGLNVDQAGQSLGISTTTAYRHWNYARAWLFREFWGEAEKEKASM